MVYWVLPIALHRVRDSDLADNRQRPKWVLVGCWACAGYYQALPSCPRLQSHLVFRLMSATTTSVTASAVCFPSAVPVSASASIASTAALRPFTRWRGWGWGGGLSSRGRCGLWQYQGRLAGFCLLLGIDVVPVYFPVWEPCLKVRQSPTFLCSMPEPSADDAFLTYGTCGLRLS